MTLKKDDKEIVKLKLDIIFKRIFGNENNKNVISKFLSDMLEIPQESIKDIEISNVELVPEFLEEKFGILDLKLNLDDRIVNIEIQVKKEFDFRDRTLFYWAKLFSGDLKSKEKYFKLKDTICINIVNFRIFNFEGYHSHFKVMEKDRHEVLSDKLAIHFFELPKIKKYKENKPMEDWLNLINAEKEADLMALEVKTKIPEVKEVICRLRELSADEKIRQEAYYREKRLHDEASAMDYAWTKGKKVGVIQNTVNAIRSLMETLDFSIEQAMKSLKIPIEEQGLYVRFINDPVFYEESG